MHMSRKIATACLLLVAARGIVTAAPRIRFTEADGRVVTLTPGPKRVVVLLNSLLDLWYLAGGTAVARVNGTDSVPPEALELENLGTFANPNVERLMALRPDLVIFSGGARGQKGARDLIDQAGIPSVAVTYSTYRDFMGIMDLFTSLTGRRDLYAKAAAGVQKDVDAVISRAPRGEAPKVFILFSTARSLTAELPSGDTGLIVGMLGGRNIVESSPAPGADVVDFSLEQLLARDPDVILVKTMGDVDACKARVDKELASNPAWGSLSAVRAGRVHYLPKDLFMYKANARYPEAFSQMARILYPSTFGEAR